LSPALAVALLDVPRDEQPALTIRRRRGSVNLDLEGWDANDPEVEAYLRECETATCPECGYLVELDLLVIADGVWSWCGGEP
jgi:hypothetical protein